LRRLRHGCRGGRGLGSGTEEEDPYLYIHNPEKKTGSMSLTADVDLEDVCVDGAHMWPLARENHTCNKAKSLSFCVNERLCAVPVLVVHLNSTLIRFSIIQKRSNCHLLRVMHSSQRTPLSSRSHPGPSKSKVVIEISDSEDNLPTTAAREMKRKIPATRYQ
jgi:hypothetical protein